MAGADVVGVFEEMVLLALVRYGPDAYGVSVRQDIEERVGRDIAMGAVYATLDRLQDKGMVSSTLGEPDPIRGGHPRRYFLIQAPGIAALRRARLVRDAIWDGVRLPAAGPGE